MSRNRRDPWLDAVAGRPANLDAADRDEAAAVRAYYARRRQAEDATPPDPAREVRMLNRLRARGAFAPPCRPPSLVERFARRLQAWLPSPVGGQALAAGLALVLLATPLAYMFGRPDGEDPGQTAVYRGDQPEASIRTADPGAAAAAIGQALRALGAPCRQVPEDGGLRLEAKVPAGQLAAAKAALSPWQVSVPANGVLVIHLRRP